jgi:hypothetical protein
LDHDEPVEESHNESMAVAHTRWRVPPHHFHVHGLLLLVALVHVHITLVVPLVIWIPDIIIIVQLQLVCNLVGGEPPSCPETKKIFC